MPRKIHEPRALLLLLSCMSVWPHVYIARIRINRVRKVAILFVVAASLLKKNLNASKPSEHPPQVEECLKV